MTSVVVSLVLYVVFGIMAVFVAFLIAVFGSDDCGAGGPGGDRAYCTVHAVRSLVVYGPVTVWVMGVAMGIIAIVVRSRKEKRGWPWSLAAWILLAFSTIGTFVLAAT